MILLLGVLIFIHELGHFLVAKYFNVKVETFSLGFGPKILKYTRGETTYCVSAIPFGGYVKMFGDEMGGDVPDDLKNRSFLHKPIPQRIAIALAGPLMNLLLTFVLFLCLGLIGEKVISPTLGDIAPTSAAYQAGFRSGDRVVEAAEVQSDNTIKKKTSVAIGRWDDLDDYISNHLNTAIALTVQRETEEDPIIVFVTPIGGNSKNPLKVGETVGTIEGFNFIADAPLIGVSNATSLFAQLGLQTGDQITHVNDKEVKAFRHLDEIIYNEASNQKILNLKISRYGIDPKIKEVEKLSIAWDLQKNPLPENPELIGYERPETFIGLVTKDSPAMKAGLQVGDKIVRINETPINAFTDIVSVISGYKAEDAPLQITVRRDNTNTTLEMAPRMTEIPNQIGGVDKRFTIGVSPYKAPFVENVHWKASSMTAALAWSWSKTWKWTFATLKSFQLLIQRKVSPKNLGGFIAIGQMAQKSWQLGIDAFLRIMAIISLNLFILNLLPVPVLDGGHILLFTIEAIKGSPLSVRKLEVMQQVGLFLLLFLMAFTIFNDIARILS